MYVYYMYSKTSKGLIQTTVLISPEFNDLRKKHQITLSEALRVGISIILAERGEIEYDNKLNITKRCAELKIKAAKYAQAAANMEK